MKKTINKKIAYKEHWDHPSKIVENLVSCNAHDFRIWVDMAISMARESHRRIPYDEIGEAICKKINGKNYKYIAKFFIDD